MTIADLIAYRRAKKDLPVEVEPQPHRVLLQGEARLPTVHGEFTIKAYRDARTGESTSHSYKEPPEGVVPIVRVHSECLTGDAFGSIRCDCGPQLDASLERVQAEGGAVIYLTGHEGRGIGIICQDSGLRASGRRAWTRSTRMSSSACPSTAGSMARRPRSLQDLGLHEGPAADQQSGQGRGHARLRHRRSTERVGLHVGHHPENEAYRRTKVERMGHLARGLCMSGQGAPSLSVEAKGAVVDVVASQWHTEIMDGLVAGALRGRGGAQGPPQGCGACPERSSFPSWPRGSLEAARRRSCASEWSSGEARRTSTTCAMP